VARQSIGAEFLPGLNTGAYTLRAAALLLQTSTQKVKRWAEGYTYTVLSGKTQAPPVLRRPLYVAGFVSFHDLIELAWIKGFTDAKVPLPQVRKVAERLVLELETPYPFAHHKLAVDGKKLIGREGDGDDYVSPLTGQKVFDYVEPFLVHVEFKGPLAALWRPLGKEGGVVVNPSRSFGAPILETSGIKTDVIYKAYLAEDKDVEAVAEWYLIEQDEVRAAIRFEEGWLKRNPRPKTA
jgi:uncharacterized protein (DUF433 family)